MDIHARTNIRQWIWLAKIMIIWLLIISRIFHFTGYTDNEVDVLPSAKQYIQPNWLPSDWYLNVDIGYRQLFNLIIGPEIAFFGFMTGTIVVRLLVYLLFAVVMFVWIRTFQLRFVVGLLLVFAFFSRQGLVAGEWMAGGVETKTFAYAFVLLSCAAFFSKRYSLGFLCSGAAISFHILVGLYATCCTVGALMLNWRIYWTEWRTIIKSSWLFFVSGALGLQAIVIQLLPQQNIDTDRAWDIYVMYRVPHHVLPDAWPRQLWPYPFVLATALFVVMYGLGRSRAARFTAAYALGSVALFAVGLVLYKLGHIRLLRYYWFRFPDVIMPFMSYFLVALTINDGITGSSPIRSTWFNRHHRLKVGVMNALPVILTLSAVLCCMWVLFDIHQGIRTTAEGTGWRNHDQAVLEWIAHNTPQTAVFLVDPSMDEFYVRAQRPMFVSFKHFPQTPKDILEWHQRITLANGNRTPLSRSYAANDELRMNFYNLDQGSIERIAKLYGVHYYLGKPQQPLTFERVYSNSNFTLYLIDTKH